MRVVDAWKLGRQDRDNGLLILIARDDRKIRIEVGYGLEGVLPDALCGRIINNAITPKKITAMARRGPASGAFTTVSGSAADASGSPRTRPEIVSTARCVPPEKSPWRKAGFMALLMMRPHRASGRTPSSP